MGFGRSESFEDLVRLVDREVEAARVEPAPVELGQVARRDAVAEARRIAATHARR